MIQFNPYAIGSLLHGMTRMRVVLARWWLASVFQIVEAYPGIDVKYLQYLVILDGT